MNIGESSHESKAIFNDPYKASLDRIDSSKPYEKGNVEFVCLAANWAKHTFSREVMLEFFAKMREPNLVL